MEEGRNKSPSLPSTYLTLAELQERWLKEQQRKQREKEEEEEEERKRRQKEEDEVRKREDQENRKRREENRERSKANNLSGRRPVQKNRRNQSEKSCRTSGMSEPKSEGSQVGAIVLFDGERKIDDSKKKKKNKKKKTKGKPRAEEDLTVGTKQLMPEYEEAEEKTPVVLTETVGGKEGVTSELQRNGKNLAVTGMAWEKKLPVNRSTEIGRKLNDLSLSGGKGGYERYARNGHGGQCKYKRDFGTFNSRKPQNLRDSNLVWVRKGDTSDANVAEF